MLPYKGADATFSHRKICLHQKLWTSAKSLPAKSYCYFIYFILYFTKIPLIIPLDIISAKLQKIHIYFRRDPEKNKIIAVSSQTSSSTPASTVVSKSTPTQQACTRLVSLTTMMVIYKVSENHPHRHMIRPGFSYPQSVISSQRT